MIETQIQAAEMCLTSYIQLCWPTFYVLMVACFLDTYEASPAIYASLLFVVPISPQAWDS